MGLTTTGLAGLGVAQPRARAELFERIIERIHRYFARMVFDPGEAEECVQRTLVELERSLRDGLYDPERSFNAWMWLKARTVWAGWCRERERRPQPLPEVAPAPGGGGPGEQAHVDDRLDATALLAEVAARLGDETREAFVLYYEGELTLAEVAETLGRDRRTVSRRIGEAHALLRRLLSGGGQAR